jgi:hypothetical protein
VTGGRVKGWSEERRSEGRECRLKASVIGTGEMMSEGRWAR